MGRFWIAAALCAAFIGSALPTSAPAQGLTGAELAALPADVRAFIKRRDGCDHFRGEEPTDPERAKEINTQLKKLCTGTDAQLARLRLSYATNRAVMRALAPYERKIE
ncbi:hypothetical protein [Azorhizobium oxalatiphilum]|nr:hypothetical protein [Azorhizobium oxalatiphilum]